MTTNIISVADSLNDKMQSCLVETQGSTHRRHSATWSWSILECSQFTTYWFMIKKKMPDNIPKFKKIYADDQKRKLKLLYGSQFEYADLVDLQNI